MKKLRVIVNDIQKFYNSSPVFREKINFELGGGEALFIYGKNGSGKTTLLRILAGIIEPDLGEVKLNTGDVTYNPPQYLKMFFVGHEPALYKHLSSLENIEFWSKIYGKSPGKDEVEGSLALFGVHKYLNTEVKNLSQGTKKKVYLSLYSIVEPDVFVVDEPFSNLDEDGQKKLAELFRSHVMRDRILIFSSPEMGDAQKIMIPEKKLKTLSL